MSCADVGYHEVLIASSDFAVSVNTGTCQWGMRLHDIAFFRRYVSSDAIPVQPAAQSVHRTPVYRTPDIGRHAASGRTSVPPRADVPVSRWTTIDDALQLPVVFAAEDKYGHIRNFAVEECGVAVDTGSGLQSTDASMSFDTAVVDIFASGELQALCMSRSAAKRHCGDVLAGRRTDVCTS